MVFKLYSGHDFVTDGQTDAGGKTICLTTLKGGDIIMSSIITFSEIYLVSRQELLAEAKICEHNMTRVVQ